MSCDEKVESVCLYNVFFCLKGKMGLIVMVVCELICGGLNFAEVIILATLDSETTDGVRYTLLAFFCVNGVCLVLTGLLALWFSFSNRISSIFVLRAIETFLTFLLFLLIVLTGLARMDGYLMCILALIMEVYFCPITYFICKEEAGESYQDDYQQNDYEAQYHSQVNNSRGSAPNQRLRSNLIK
jgi:hypothetical protein